MSKIIGIDPGYNKLLRGGHGGGRRGRRHPQRGGQPHHPVGGGLLQGRRAQWWARWPSARPSPTPTGPSAPSRREMGLNYKVTIDGKSYTPQEISAHDSPEAQDRRRGLSGPDRHRGGHQPCPPTSPTPSARPPRTPARSPVWTSSASSTSPPPRPWPTAWIRRAPRRSWSTTWAAAPSTSRFWTSTTA